MAERAKCCCGHVGQREGGRFVCRVCEAAGREAMEWPGDYYRRADLNDRSGAFVPGGRIAGRVRVSHGGHTGWGMVPVARDVQEIDSRSEMYGNVVVRGLSDLADLYALYAFRSVLVVGEDTADAVRVFSGVLGDGVAKAAERGSAPEGRKADAVHLVWEGGFSHKELFRWDGAVRVGGVLSGDGYHLPECREAVLAHARHKTSDVHAVRTRINDLWYLWKRG